MPLVEPLIEQAEDRHPDKSRNQTWRKRGAPVLGRVRSPQIPSSRHPNPSDRNKSERAHLEQKPGKRIVNYQTDAKSIRGRREKGVEPDTQQHSSDGCRVLFGRNSQNRIPIFETATVRQRLDNVSCLLAAAIFDWQ